MLHNVKKLVKFEVHSTLVYPHTDLSGLCNLILGSQHINLNNARLTYCQKCPIVTASGCKDVQSLRIPRELIIKEQHQGSCQTKVTNVFSLVCRPTSPSPDSPEPVLSGLTPPGILESSACGDFEGFTLPSEAMDQE